MLPSPSLKTSISERHYQDKVLSALEKHFFIHTQVSGKHFTGKRFLIDAVIQPKDTSKWKNQNVALGIEFKSPEKIKNTNDSTGWIAQCIDYAQTDWDKFGYLNVFSCPALFDSFSVPAVQDGKWLLHRLLSNLGIGELKEHKTYGWTLYLQDSHRIWSERDGVISGKKWSLERKFGSR